MKMRRGRWALEMAACGLAAAAMWPAETAAQEGAERVAIEVRGESTGTDEAARTRAVDQAFGAAAERGIAALVGEKEREQNRASIGRGIMRRAREFVSSYRVVSEKADGGRTQVAISATLDLAKLRAALTELKVPVSTGVRSSLAPADGAGSGRGGALLLLVVSTPDGTVANFGRNAGDGGAAGDAFRREIQALGLRPRSAAGEPVQVSGGEGEALVPVGDDAAIELARRIGAGSVWVVGIEVRADGPIRATRLQGAAGRGKLRVLDAERGEVVAESEAQGAGFDRNIDQAAAQAARDLVQRLAGAVAGRVDERWSVAASTGGPQIVVRVRGAHTWASIGALIQKLNATGGIDAVHAREVARGRVALGVETRLDSSRVASVLQQARLATGTVVAQARGERQVDVEIRGDTTFTEGAVQETGDAEPSPE